MYEKVKLVCDLTWIHENFYWLVISVPKKFLQSLLFLAVVFLPLYIYNDVGVMLILSNGQCPQLFRVYYFGAFVYGDGGTER
jgi:hypothetical protein